MGGGCHGIEWKLYGHDRGHHVLQTLNPKPLHPPARAEPLMRAHAQAVAGAQGDVLNVGFGMGLVDAAIQVLRQLNSMDYGICPKAQAPRATGDGLPCVAATQLEAGTVRAWRVTALTAPFPFYVSGIGLPVGALRLSTCRTFVCAGTPLLMPCGGKRQAFRFCLARQELQPRSHTIIEAHPDVHRRMLEDGASQLSAFSVSG